MDRVRRSSQPNTTFRILVKNEFAGGIGLMRKTDIHSRTFEFRYWLGELYWGKGIMSRCVKLILPSFQRKLTLGELKPYRTHNKHGFEKSLEKNDSYWKVYCAQVVKRMLYVIQPCVL